MPWSLIYTQWYWCLGLWFTHSGIDALVSDLHTVVLMPWSLIYTQWYWCLGLWFTHSGIDALVSDLHTMVLMPWSLIYTQWYWCFSLWIHIGCKQNGLWHVYTRGALMHWFLIHTEWYWCFSFWFTSVVNKINGLWHDSHWHSGTDALVSDSHLTGFIQNDLWHDLHRVVHALVSVSHTVVLMPQALVHIHQYWCLGCCLISYSHLFRTKWSLIHTPLYRCLGLYIDFIVIIYTCLYVYRGLMFQFIIINIWL